MANMEPLPKVEDLIQGLRRHGIELPAGVARVGALGDSADQSEELLSLIRQGRKRGGASLVWAHEADSEPIPSVGEIEIVVDHLNEPSVVTRITSVEVVPFNQVSAQFAAREGEGDGTLEYWRKAHWAFFARECERIGRVPSHTMPVVCSSFDVVNVVPRAAISHRNRPSTMRSREIFSTPRLVLRATVESDVGALHDRVFSDVDVIRFVFAGKPFSEAESAEFIHGRFNFAGGEIGLSSLEERSSGELIGFSGLIPCRALGADDLELGFVLARSAWGKGYATEIGLAQIDFGFNRLGRRRLLALVDPANSGSIHVLRKLGMRHESELPIDGRGLRDLYSIEASR